MNKEAENYRGLSIASLVTGLLTCTIGFAITEYPVSIFPLSQIVNSLASYGGILTGEFISYGVVGVVIGLGLPIAAIVCGSIDLSRIQAGKLSDKGRGFDITGIVLGSIYLIMRGLEELNIIELTL
jgi:hypothetical protein